jgi:transcriptional regulator with XRE-family HTH domain
MGNTPSEVASRIRQARIEAGLNQLQLAARIGVTGSVISRYEKGALNIPVATLIAIAEQTGVSPAEFFDTAELPAYNSGYRAAMAEVSKYATGKADRL